jgi:hypothetical protein
MQPLDLDEETRRLEELDRSSPGVEVRFLPHASAGIVREALSEDTYNVLHFMGHGTFDRASGEGMLAFEAEDGSTDLVSGKAFATKLRDLRSLGVVVLNACNTARAGHQGGTSPFRGVATALVLGGVPAVVAMQRPISDRAAIGFSTAFYRHLAKGDSIDVALTEGRQAIHSAKPESFEWATPVLFLRMPEGNVFVAKPVVPTPEPAKPVVEAPIAAPPPLPERIVQTSPKRGLVIKVAAGVAGAVLVIVVSMKVMGPSRGTDSLPGKEPITSSTPAVTPPVSPDTITQKGKVSKTNPKTERDHQVAKGPELGNSNVPPKDTVTQQTLAVTPTPTPPPVKQAETVEPSVSAADLSLLSMQVASVERKESLRVTVIFKNTGDHKLTLNLDKAASALRDDKRSYPTLDPGAGHLELAPNASSRITFSFLLPQLGSENFRLALMTTDGQSLKDVRFSAKSEGSP